MRYLLALTLAIGFISLGCEKKTTPAADPNLPVTPTEDTFMTGTPTSSTAPAIAPTPSPYPTPVVTPRPTPKPSPSLTLKGARNYTIQKGDTLTGIARTQLGGASRVKDILAVNPDLTKDSILPIGKVIKLPEK